MQQKGNKFAFTICKIESYRLHMKKRGAWEKFKGSKEVCIYVHFFFRRKRKHMFTFFFKKHFQLQNSNYGLLACKWKNYEGEQRHFSNEIGMGWFSKQNAFHLFFFFLKTKSRVFWSNLHKWIYLISNIFFRIVESDFKKFVAKF